MLVIKNLKSEFNQHSIRI